MPIYEYRCEGCGKHWEENLPMKDYRKPIERGCVYCEGDVPSSGVVKRVFPQPRLQFSGDGFASTDLSQIQIDTTPEFWYKDGDPTNNAKENKLDKPNVKVLK